MEQSGWLPALAQIYTDTTAVNAANNNSFAPAGAGCSIFTDGGFHSETGLFAASNVDQLAHDPVAKANEDRLKFARKMHSCACYLFVSLH